MCIEYVVEWSTPKSVVLFQSFHHSEHPVLLIRVMYEEHTVLSGGIDVEQW